jgi:antirestriction protein ArdC
MAKKKKPYQDPRQTFTETIRVKMEQGLAPWQKPWSPDIWTPFNPVSGTIYQGINRIILTSKESSDPRWLTFLQLEKLGYFVKKGEKGVGVEFWRRTKDTIALDEKGHPIRNLFGTPEIVQIELAKPIIRHYKLFNATQIIDANGNPPPPAPKRTLTWDPCQKAEEIIANSGVKIVNDQSNRAYFDQLTRIIHLPKMETFNSASGYYATALHELSHFALNLQRGKPAPKNKTSPSYAREEIRVELASWMVCQDLGLDREPNLHSSYIIDWLKILETDHHEVARAAADAEKLKRLVLSFAAGPIPTPPIIRLKGPSGQPIVVASHYETFPSIFGEGEFPSPTDDQNENYDFSQEILPRVTSLNRLLQNLLKPGLVLERAKRWETFYSQIREIHSRTWSRCFNFNAFLEEAVKIANAEFVATHKGGPNPPHTRAEVSVYNAVLSVVHSARCLELEGFYLNLPKDPNEPFCRMVPVAKAAPGDTPLTVKVLDQFVDLFKEVPESKATRFLTLDAKDTVLAIFLKPNHALDFVEKLRSPKDDLLEDFKEEEKTRLWRFRKTIVKYEPAKFEVTPERRAYWEERLRNSCGIFDYKPNEPGDFPAPTPAQPAPVPMEPDKPASTPMEPDKPAPTPMEPDKPAPTPMESDKPAPSPIEPENEPYVWTPPPYDPQADADLAFKPANDGAISSDQTPPPLASVEPPPPPASVEPTPPLASVEPTPLASVEPPPPLASVEPTPPPAPDPRPPVPADRPETLFPETNPLYAPRPRGG